MKVFCVWVGGGGGKGGGHAVLGGGDRGQEQIHHNLCAARKPHPSCCHGLDLSAGHTPWRFEACW
jgi:hypothetical protein